jgi:hypothetical protein
VEDVRVYIRVSLLDVIQLFAYQFTPGFFVIRARVRLTLQIKGSGNVEDGGFV